MKKIFLLLCTIVFVSCSNNQAKIKAVEGYWNINQVTLPDGSDREFPFSNHMDHFEIEGSKGVKNRVSPTYDGGFISYGSPVYFKWEEIDGEIKLSFNDGDQAYQQIVKKATDETLVLLHENGTTYKYLKHIPNEK
jgi:hypothetical protein